MPPKTFPLCSHSQKLIAKTNTHQNLWHIVRTLATLKVIRIPIHARGMSSYKAKVGVFNHVSCYDGLFQSKNTKRSIHLQNILTLSWWQKAVCGWPNWVQCDALPHVHDVWPIKTGANLIPLEASILEDDEFKVAWFGEYRGVQQGSLNLKHPTTRNGKVAHYSQPSKPHHQWMTLAYLSKWWLWRRWTWLHPRIAWFMLFKTKRVLPMASIITR